MAERRTIEDLIDDYEAQLAESFRAAIEAVRDRVEVGVLTQKITAGDIQGAVAAVGVHPLAFRTMELVLAQAYEAGGIFTANAVPPARDGAGLLVKVLFNARDPRAESWLRTKSSQMVREVTDETREAVQQVLSAGVAQGSNPKTIALNIVGRINPATKQREGGILGLTSQQERWVANYAKELEAGSPKALKRVLRDGRFDKTVLNAIKNGEPIPADKRAKMVQAYKKRALKSRAVMLARTEVTAAMHESQVHAIEQAVAAGQTTEDKVDKIWNSARDLRVRLSHRKLDKQRVPFRGLFKAPSGATLAYPGDPTAPAEERIGCRCWMRIRVRHT